MIAMVEQHDGTYVDDERVPKCGEDFCDWCGDCLHCYGGDPCRDGSAASKHVWVVYRSCTF